MRNRAETIDGLAIRNRVKINPENFFWPKFVLHTMLLVIMLNLLYYGGMTDLMRMGLNLIIQKSIIVRTTDKCANPPFNFHIVEGGSRLCGGEVRVWK